MTKVINEILMYGLLDWENIVNSIIKELNLESMYFDIRLLFTEAVSNAYYHGNKEDDTKLITLNYKYDGNLLNIMIKDSNTETIYVSIPNELKNEDILNDCGKGLYLINCLADKVSFQNNTLIIDKYIDKVYLEKIVYKRKLWAVITKMRTSLKTKLILIFLVLITVPLSLLGVMSYKMSSKALQSTIQEELGATTTSTVDGINNTLESVKNNIKIASYNDQLSQVIMQQSNSNNKVNIQKFLSQIQKNNSNIEMFILTDANGKGILSNESVSINLDINDRDYFKKAIKGEEAISDVIISKVTNKPVIAIAYPIKSGDKIIGVLTGTVHFDSISIHVSKVKVGKTGYGYMIDKNGIFVYHPKANKVMKENLGNTDNKELKAIVNKMKDGETGEGFYTYEGVRKYVRFEPAGNWIVAITVPYNDYMSSALNIKNNTIIIVLLSILIAMTIAYFISTINIVRPIKKLQAQMDLAGSGDLTAHIDINTGDEIQSLGESFNLMINHQEEIVSRVRNGSEQLAISADELASAAEEISASTEEISSSTLEVSNDAKKQSDSVTDVSQVLVQLSSLVQLAQIKAIDAEKNAQSTSITAQYGREKVEETVQAMDIINKGTNETSNVLKVVNELSIKVENIIETINSIADQTNLLALNASIEAARAGENGKGFMVVADEVRKLAEESNLGAQEISNLVTTMAIEIGKAVVSMNHTSEAVNNGVKIVEETDKSFINIMNALDHIKSNIDEVVDVTKDEVATSDQIIKLIDTMGTISENTSRNSENVASAAEEQNSIVETMASTAEELSAMTSELESMIEKFKIRTK